MSSDAMKPFWGLLSAGFTPDELQAIATDLQFGVIAATETGQDIHIAAGDSVHWTPEKRTAWNVAVGDFLGQVRHPGDEPA